MSLQLLKYWKCYLYAFYIELFHPNSKIVLYAKSLDKVNNNWGDDIGEQLLSFISTSPIVFYRYSLIGRYIRKKPHYLIVGSIIPQFSKSDSIIWGSGVGESGYHLKNKPAKVLAVRGPLSRQYLLDRGVDCPKVYGDPALLFPLYYNPVKIKKKYKIGFIPHVLDITEELIKYIDSLGDEVVLIEVNNYGCWNDFIDKILQCEMIFSSSLHGLIISDAYNVPNIWAEFTHIMGDNGFKFHDYLLSVDKDVSKPLKINGQNIDTLLLYKQKYKKAVINIKDLLECCPFNK